MKNPQPKLKVAVAMSGGIDSSVAALLLQQQGCDVHGFFMRNWSPLSDIANDCPWQKDYEDVRKVCHHLGIPCATFNFEREYKERVLNYFLSEYQAGRTPNPDVLCNREIKFDLFLSKAEQLGFDYIATGHYAKITHSSKQDISLLRPKDRNKDQTYFLCYLRPEQLQKTLFPLSDLTKNEVRSIARRAGLPNADKKDSQGICFIGKLPVREFLRANLTLSPGVVVDKQGKVWGKHQGSQLYTIGQRHIGLSTGRRAQYVARKNVATNTLVVDDEQSLYTDRLAFSQANWLAEVPDTFTCEVQLRYRAEGISALVNKAGEIRLSTPARAVTQGQFAAFYRDGKLLGGAVIK